MQTSSPKWSRVAQLRVIVIPVLVVILGGLVVYRTWFLPPPDPTTEYETILLPDTPPADPRVQFPSPFRNTAAQVKYVGDAACSACHPIHDKNFHQHPMGRSASQVSAGPTVERYGAGVNLPFNVGTHRLDIAGEGANARHLLTCTDVPNVPPYEVKPGIAIGSGTRGKSYFSFESGAVWQSPISWFTAEKQWDLSPGFWLDQGGRRPVPAECINCHVNRIDPIPRTRNSFREAVLGPASIGCERCHGPGELHVAERSAGKPLTGRDDTIVNSKYLDRNLQLDVCRQCHLLGEQSVIRREFEVTDYRPGLPLEHFRSIFSPPPAFAKMGKSVGQFDQLVKSRCFTANETMTCTTCHDPHEKKAPAETVAYFRGKCLTCHQTTTCKETEPRRKAAADNCMTCHMPRNASTTIVHAAVTDHTIRRRPDRVGQADPSLVADPNVILISSYPKSKYSIPKPELDRDLGVGLSLLALKLEPGPQTTPMLTLSERLLGESLKRWPADEPAWVALANLYMARKEYPKAVKAAREAVRANPRSEFAWVAIRDAEYASGNAMAALDASDKLVAISPSALDHQVRRAAVLVGLEKWTDAEAACRDALKINPQHAEAHIILSACLTRLNRHAEARKELDAGFALTSDPKFQAEYRNWLQQHR